MRLPLVRGALQDPHQCVVIARESPFFVTLVKSYLDQTARVRDLCPEDLPVSQAPDSMFIQTVDFYDVDV